VKDLNFTLYNSKVARRDRARFAGGDAVQVRGAASR
jgi:hypothetical protein